jgi:hypothetical protein
MPDLTIMKEFEDLGISKNELISLNQMLKIPEKKLTSNATEKREKYVKEAILWKSGKDQQNRIITIVYDFRDWKVAVGKPGKEADINYKGFRNYKTGLKGNNPNDMNPHILHNGKKIEKDLTFQEIFEEVEKMKRADLFGLEVFGMLIFRMAFMLDHKEDSNGNIRYSPDKKLLEILEKRIPEISEKKIKPFLFYLDVLGLNEDIKVNEGGHGLSGDYGRINTLLTFAHLIAVLLNRRPLFKFAGQFSRPPSGMAPIPKTRRGGIFESYPLLDPLLFEEEK